MIWLYNFMKFLLMLVEHQYTHYCPTQEMWFIYRISCQPVHSNNNNNMKYHNMVFAQKFTNLFCFLDEEEVLRVETPMVDYFRSADSIMAC